MVAARPCCSRCSRHRGLVAAALWPAGDAHKTTTTTPNSLPVVWVSGRNPPPVYTCDGATTSPRLAHYYYSSSSDTVRPHGPSYTSVQQPPPPRVVLDPPAAVSYHPPALLVE